MDLSLDPSLRGLRHLRRRALTSAPQSVIAELGAYTGTMTATSDADYDYYKITDSGDLTITKDGYIQIMGVGPGGGGGGSYYSSGGGGGAGAVRGHDGSLWLYVTAGTYPINVGTGDAPIRLSTDPTERLSTDPLTYGTRSTWDGADPQTEPYLFVLATAQLPGDEEDAPSAATIVLDNVDAGIAALLRSFTDRPTIHMAVVLASSPDLVEVEYRGLKIIAADGTAAEVSLSVSRAPIEDETVPMDRFTKDRFPGLFR